MNTSRIKLLIGMLIAICLVIGAYFYFGDTVTLKAQGEQGRNDYQSLEKMLMLTESMIYDRLVESSYLLAENSTFKANLQLNDKESLNYSAREFALFLKTDLFAIIGNDGAIEFDYNNRLEGNSHITHFPPVKKALMGYEPDVKFKNVDLFYANGTLYQATAVPVFAGQQKILGVIMMGINFTDFVLKPLADTFPFELILYYDKQFISCSVPNSDSRDVKTQTIDQGTDLSGHTHSGNYSADITNHPLSFTKHLNKTQNASLISVYIPEHSPGGINP